MDTIKWMVSTAPEIFLLVAVALGTMLGRMRIGGFSIGTTACTLIVAVLHNRLPDVAGTLGISFVAAMQAASFPRVESWAYSSVMATTNLRQTIEGLFIAVTGSADPHRFRRPGVFAIVVGAFGVGAVASAYVTVQVPSLTLGIPVAFLLMALLRCEQDPDPVAS